MTDLGAVPPVARLAGVSHLYRKVQALRDVTLDLPAGQMIGLIGPDGVGKTPYHDLGLRESLDFFGKLYGLRKPERVARISG